MGILFTCRCIKVYVCAQMWCTKTVAATTNQLFNQSLCTDHHPNCFKENYTLLYFIPPRSPVINAVVSDTALQTHTEPQWGDCLSASAVSSTSFHSNSIHLQFFSQSAQFVKSLLWAIKQTHTRFFLIIRKDSFSISSIHPSLKPLPQHLHVSVHLYDFF